MNNKFISTHRLLFFASSLLFTISNSCTDAPRHAKSENNTTTPGKPPSGFLDTLTITGPAAVFYSPDSLQLKKIKSLTEPAIFDGSMHEYYYLMRNAKMVVAKTMPHLEIIEAKNVRYLLFTRHGNQKDCIDLNLYNNACGLFLFDGVKAPHESDMANIETTLESYFLR
jgi:hypothetical protein